MEFSPLRFLDYDVSLKLSDQVRTTREEQARKYHEKQYKDVESWEIGHYDHYEENYNANQYNLNVSCIEAFNSHYKIIDCIKLCNPEDEDMDPDFCEHEESMLSFAYISSINEGKTNIVKTIINNFKEPEFNWEDGMEVYIEGYHDCDKPNYYSAGSGRNNDCMCNECRKNK